MAKQAKPAKAKAKDKSPSRAVPYVDAARPPARAPAPARASTTPTPRASNWPWAPGTLAQGWLSHRWNRRDGMMFGRPLAAQVANAPVRGGDDLAAHVAYCQPTPDGT